MKYKTLTYTKIFPLKDEQHQPIFDAMKHLDVIIAGGYCLTRVQALHGNFLTRSSDIDIFCLDNKNFQEALTAGLKVGHITHQTDTAVSMRLEPKQVPGPETENSPIFQIIKPPKRAYTSFNELVEDFDFNNSKYWSVPPFDVIHTNQDNKRLFQISCSKRKWNYHFIGRILKYHGQKHLILPNDVDKFVDLIKRENLDVFQRDRNNYVSTTEDVKKHYEGSLFKMIALLYFKKHPASHIITKEINVGCTGYIHLEKIFQNNVHNNTMPVSNFLFDYWLQKEYHDDIAAGNDFISSVGPALENVDYFKRNKKKVQKFYPELML